MRTWIELGPSQFRILSLIATAAFSHLVVSAQADDIRVATEHVSVPVTVLDRNGRYIPGLQKSDFVILEDGKLQEITEFRSVEEPFTALLLLDTSGSLNDHFTKIASAAGSFVGMLRPNDTVMVAAFADRAKLEILVQPTKRSELKARIALQPRYGDSATMTFNAVDEGLKVLEKVKGRKALILFSDGEMFGRGVSMKDNVRRAEESDVVIYTVRFGQYPMYQPGYTKVIMPEDIKRYGNTLGLTRKELQKLVDRVKGYMDGLAEKTGGRGFQFDLMDDLKGSFRTIAGELGQQYALGYEPSKSPLNGERRTIYVRVNIPGAVVRSRKEVLFKK